MKDDIGIMINGIYLGFVGWEGQTISLAASEHATPQEAIDFF